MTLKNKIKENGLDLGEMEVWMVQVDARAQHGFSVEVQGLLWKVAQVS